MICFHVTVSNVRPDDQILCSGDPRGASAMKTEEDIGPAVNHSFIVSPVLVLALSDQGRSRET